MPFHESVRTIERIARCLLQARCLCSENGAIGFKLYSIEAYFAGGGGGGSARTPELHITLESYRLRIHLKGPKFSWGGGTPPDPIEGTLSPASNSVPPLFFIPGSAPDYHTVPTMHE